MNDDPLASLAADLDSALALDLPDVLGEDRPEAQRKARRAPVVAVRDAVVPLPDGLRHVRDTRTRRYLQHGLDVGQAVAHLDPLPRPGETLHGILTGRFHSFDLLPALLRLIAPATVTDLYIATLSFNRKNTDELCALLDAGAVQRVTFLCSVYFRETSPAEFEALADELGRRGQRVAAHRNHCKVIAAATTGGCRWVFETSANLRSCNCCEQFSLTDDAGLYGFHVGWLERLIGGAV